MESITVRFSYVPMQRYRRVLPLFSNRVRTEPRSWRVSYYCMATVKSKWPFRAKSKMTPPLGQVMFSTQKLRLCPLALTPVFAYRFGTDVWWAGSVLVNGLRIWGYICIILVILGRTVVGLFSLINILMDVQK